MNLLKLKTHSQWRSKIGLENIIKHTNLFRTYVSTSWFFKLQTLFVETGLKRSLNERLRDDWFILSVISVGSKYKKNCAARWRLFVFYF